MTNRDNPREINDSNNETDSDEDYENICPICQDRFSLKTKLECNHMFCFLCIKGSNVYNGLCPLCRSPIDPRSILTPRIADAHVPVPLFENNFLWYYEGSNGWWMYERRDSIDIEKSFQEDPEKVIERLISGRLYVIDFSEMKQWPKDFPNRKRRIKRDVFDPDCKGIAGVVVDLSGMVRA